MTPPSFDVALATPLALGPLQNPYRPIEVDTEGFSYKNSTQEVTTAGPTQASEPACWKRVVSVRIVPHINVSHRL